MCFNLITEKYFDRWIHFKRWIYLNTTSSIKDLPDDPDDPDDNDHQGSISSSYCWYSLQNVEV